MKRILIVEDEPSIAMVLEDDMRGEGYQTEVASDGDTAIRRATSQPFDLILLDIMLPGKDGFEVCREVRRAGLQTPIILLTARTQEAEKVMGLELGADDYVTKPYSARELRARQGATSPCRCSYPRDLPFRRCRSGFRALRIAALRETRRPIGVGVQAAYCVREKLRARPHAGAVAGSSLGARDTCNRSRSR